MRRSMPWAEGARAGLVFVAWLAIQSVWVIGALCPWCMVTWLVTIPTFYAVLLHVLLVPRVRGLAHQQLLGRHFH